ncbi:MAG: hypothetical protein ACI33M_02395 [Lysinibacillus sp.]
MKETCKNVKKPLLFVGAIGLLIAGLLDLKYKGLFYQAIKKVACLDKCE